jgi:hypothetical protein
VSSPILLSAPRFLVTEGGPLFLLETRIGIVKKNSPGQIRRAAFSVLLTWLPLFALSALQATPSAAPSPYHFSRISPEAASHFVNSGLVMEQQFYLFSAAIERGLKSRDSVAAEIWIALLAYAMTVIFFIPNAVQAAAWYADRSADGFRPTLAGWWLLGFCIPLGHFLVLRWLWRFFLWCRFLSDMNKLDLQLYPTHPHQAGGLGFIGKVQRFFGILRAAYSATVAGVWANEIFYDHVSLEHFALPAAAYVVAAGIRGLSTANGYREPK